MVKLRASFVTWVLPLICPLTGLAQTAPRELFIVCGSQPNQPTVYFSAVLEGPATALQGFRNGFTSYLSQRYGYQGVVVCLPANTAANAQNAINQRSAALRNAKKTVVETGWTQPAAVAAAPAAVPQLPAARQARAAAPVATAAAQTQAPSAGGSGSASGGGSELSSILGAVFAGGGVSAANGATAGGAGRAPGAVATSDSTQGAAAQVASTLASAFSSKSSSTSGGDAPSTSKADAPQVLGSAQAQNTKLLVYGCGRQDKQVACVTDLVNQNHQDTLVQAAGIWKDAFIVDDRGDRHVRSGGFFLNVDGDQRQQLDISYGKSAQFILMFDNVQTKVQKVALRSTADGLDVEDIGLVMPADGPQPH